MTPNMPESVSFGLLPPPGLGLGSCLGQVLGYQWVRFPHYLAHFCYLLRFKQKNTNCFNLSFFDLIQFFFIKFVLNNYKNYEINKKNKELKTICNGYEQLPATGAKPPPHPPPNGETKITCVVYQLCDLLLSQKVTVQMRNKARGLCFFCPYRICDISYLRYISHMRYIALVIYNAYAIFNFYRTHMRYIAYAILPY